MGGNPVSSFVQKEKEMYTNYRRKSRSRWTNLIAFQCNGSTQYISSLKIQNRKKCFYFCCFPGVGYQI